MQRECNAENPSITKNQEPIKKQQQQQTREDKIFSQPENPATPFDRFAMHGNWQPANLDTVNGLLRRAGLPSYETGLVLDAALDFVAYWVGRPEVEQTAAQWDSEFVRSATKFRAKHGHKYNTATWELLSIITPQSKSDITTKPEAPKSNIGSKTKKSLTILNEINHEIKSGRVKFGLPETVSVAIVDGLTSLVSARLNYPPPSDAWGETIKEWCSEFERAKHDVKVNEMNPIVNAETVSDAFQSAKHKATQMGNTTSRFPSVRDVIACLPKQLVREEPVVRQRSEREKEVSDNMLNIIKKNIGIKV